MGNFAGRFGGDPSLEGSRPGLGLRQLRRRGHVAGGWIGSAVPAGVGFQGGGAEGLEAGEQFA